MMHDAARRAINYGCTPTREGIADPGLWFCTIHHSYGFSRLPFCHANSGPDNGHSRTVTRAWDGPPSSPFTTRAIRALLPVSGR